MSEKFAISRTAIPGVMLIEPKRFGDHRGFFSETYSRDALRLAGFDREFVQDNHSLSERPGTLRGLHFQSAPFAQDKLVRCVRGAIFDVAVDIRKGSPTFGSHVAVELSDENWRQLLIPRGFAHGFLTLTPACEVVYKVTAPYSADHDLGVAFDDPALAIAWPTSTDRLVVSEKDRRHPRLADLPPYFPADVP